MLFIDILAAYILDAAVGDPPWLPHPVRLIGWLIGKTERRLWAIIQHMSGPKEKKELIAGAVLTFWIVAVSFTVAFAILAAAKQAHPVFFHAVNIYFLYSALAGRCLADESLKVYRSLKRNSISEAREQTGMLVGRDTKNLDQEEIIRAIVETTAENTVDGVLSPLFFIFLGSLFGIGAPLVYAFKAASTLDSMIGYLNERYLYFGRVSAKLDDALNYIPARLSGMLIPVAAFFCGKGFRRSFQTMLRDRRNHQSPNCAYPEAAVAGALGVRLGGTNIYFGRPVEKPAIGDALKDLELRDIPDTVKIMWMASFLALAIGMVLSMILA
ncbi:MAG: adenosylcobinamide-phosphate synthase CbiB [Firmicutes bacterium]|nr:adenosylcobinamide-phosphate synthase CbiB [Bacillota bacterium]